VNSGNVKFCPNPLLVPSLKYFNNFLNIKPNLKILNAGELGDSMPDRIIKKSAE
jgi:hypothetical protein